MSLDWLSVTQQAQLTASGEVSARELTQHSLDAIARRNADMKAFVTVLFDAALAQADALDAEFARTGRPVGPLHGVPIAIKDELNVRGVITGMGTNAVAKPAADDCEAVRRLREAGAVIVGKTAMSEFGQWPLTETTTNGYTRNPWNRLFSVAGSSGGTGAAVSSGMVAAGMGADGGGSIRLPAAWCGLVGLKPQRGRVSTSPNHALWRGLGVLGPLTRTVADSALLFDTLASHLPEDKYEAQPWDEPLTTTIQREPEKLRILLAEATPESAGIKLEAQTRAALHKVADALAGAGHIVDEGSLPAYKPGLTMTGQMAAGVRDEYKLIDSVSKLEARSRQAAMIYKAAGFLAAGAERRADALATQVFKVFDDYDIVLMPTIAHPPLLVGQLDGASVLGAIRASLPIIAYTAIWNVLGNPAVAVPSGFTANGLPLSVQLAAAPNREPLLLQVAAQIERLLPWSHVHPPVVTPGL